ARAATAARAPSAARAHTLRGDARSPTCARRSSVARADGIECAQRPAAGARAWSKQRMHPRRLPRLLCASLMIGVLAAGLARAAADADSERAAVDEWRAARLKSLTSDTGWLTLAGLLWLQEGHNSFGRAADNTLVLDNPALAAHAGSFEVAGSRVRFLSAPNAHVTHAGQEVRELELTSDAV